MLKRYISGSQLRIVSGGRDFCFSPTSTGSDYMTSDETEQRLLESHYEYGHQFVLDSTMMAVQHRIEKEAEAMKKAIEEKKALVEAEKLRRMQEKAHEKPDQMSDRPESVTNSPWQEVDVSDSGVTIVEVQSVTDARNYLYDKFGISKTRMLKKNDLMNRAAECSVKFQGKDF